MNVYLKPEDWLSRGIKRVATALAQYAPPGVAIVNDPARADLVVLHVVGHGGWNAERDLARKVAVVQYCLRTSEDASTAAWLPLWRHAKVVWSYYDLAAVLEADGLVASSVNFYDAPLGVDGGVFFQSRQPQRYTLGTSGFVDWSESLGECAAAVAAVGGRMFHLGPDLQLGPHVESLHGMPDHVLAELYSSCLRVSGLRRVEGFELPMFEGLCCGARPVTFAAPHYERWLGEHADYVPEVAPAELVPLLTTLLATPPRPVTEAERNAVVAKFQWATVAKGFWERAL